MITILGIRFEDKDGLFFVNDVEVHEWYFYEMFNKIQEVRSDLARAEIKT